MTDEELADMKLFTEAGISWCPNERLSDGNQIQARQR